MTILRLSLAKLVMCVILMPSASSASERYVAVTVPRRTVSVSAPFEGLLETVDVALGQRVTSGDKILSVSIELLSHDLQIERSALRVAEGMRTKARISVARAEEQLRHVTQTSGAYSQNEIKTAEYELQLAEQELEIAKTRIEEQQNRINRLNRLLEQSVVTAPFDGTVSARVVDPGTRVAAHTPVVRIISSRELLIRFAVPVDVASSLALGDDVWFLSEDEAVYFRGTVHRIAPEIDAALRRVVVEATISKDATDSTKPGLPGFVSLTPPGR